MYTGRYLVNLDKDVMSLIAETKHLLRMGIEVPESARTLLLQEGAVRGHMAALTSLLEVCFWVFCCGFWCFVFSDFWPTRGGLTFHCTH